MRNDLPSYLTILLCAACGARSSLDFAPSPTLSTAEDSGPPPTSENQPPDAGSLIDAFIPPPLDASDATSAPEDANPGEDAPSDASDAAETAAPGSPLCAAGETSCAGACVVLAADNANCGGCDIACAPGESCVASVCQPNVSIWPTFGGDVHHDGYNATETGTPPLTVAWTAMLGAPAAQIAAAASDGNAVYVAESLNDLAPNQTYGWALSPVDGSILWTYHFGSAYTAGQMTVDNGHVYVNWEDVHENDYLVSLVSTTGAEVWKTSAPDQWNYYWAPLVIDGRVYFAAGESGDLYAVDQATGGQEFSEVEQQAGEWIPLFLNDALYTFVEGQFNVYDPLSGVVLNTKDVQWNGNDYDPFMTPVSDGTNIYVVAPPDLLSFSPALAPLWTTTGGSTYQTGYDGEPAVANGVVYALLGGTLRAHDAATGAVLWSFAADGALTYPPVVAGHYVYVSSALNAYAIDVDTQTQVWTTSPGGWLSIANGQLYVAGYGTLTAWQMTQ